MRRFQDEISGIDADQLLGPVQQEIARRRTYHSRFEKRCNTDLLTCVREHPLLRPRPAFSQVFPAMTDFRPSG